MSTSFKDLEFSFKQIHILKKLRNDGCISKDTVRSNPKYSFLLKYNLLDNDPDRYDIYRPSDKALMYLRFRRKDLFRTWYPHVVSSLAFICSIASLIINILSSVH
jgi:hypothetical protein|nr:MAG TPA: hypothetical protein [Caudoviricetes sp.]